ncbi:MAG: hypothetical protein J6C27_00310 [Clostridia bacterium]|nr:hypothetical protein [Clostridia bacterium]
MKHVKKLLCLALTVLLCFSLIGCNAIDKMRDAQIHFNDDGNLEYDGNEYKQLPPCSAFSPNITYSTNLYITDKDLPVLLSEQFGGRAYLTKDKLYINSHSYSSSDGTTAFFARTDIYDSIAERINSGNYFEGFCFYYSYWDDSDEIGSYMQKEKIISEEAEKAVKEVITTTAPDESIDIDLLSQYAVTDLYACSNDLLFSEYSATIYKTDKFIYITAFTGLNKELIFKVGEMHYDAIMEIIDSYNSLQAINNKNFID